jgi:hypothetical protein
MNEWSGVIQWGWRDTGELPEELREEFNTIDVSEVQVSFSALTKNLDQETHGIFSAGTREDPVGRPAIPSYSEATKAMCGAFNFLSKVLTFSNEPRIEWVYIVFLNRMPQLHFAKPHYTPKTELVNSVSHGLTLFGHLVSSSVIEMFSECDWVMLKLIKKANQ